MEVVGKHESSVLRINAGALPARRGVAQLARAAASKSACRRFESCRPCHAALVGRCHVGVAKLVDALDSESSGARAPWRFNSSGRHARTRAGLPRGATRIAPEAQQSPCRLAAQDTAFSARQRRFESGQGYHHGAKPHLPGTVSLTPPPCRGARKWAPGLPSETGPGAGDASLAQLVERSSRKRKATGSTPVGGSMPVTRWCVPGS